jgi:6-phosphogluconate dehydrogenase
MIGLGVMGRNLVLNMANHGFSVAGYDKAPNQLEALRRKSADRDICGAENISDFIALLHLPRAVMMLVPAGLSGTYFPRTHLASLENKRGNHDACIQTWHCSDLEENTNGYP